IGENPPYGMIGRVEETSASFEARSAPRLYPTERGWETERCRMAQTTAPILDSTWADEPACPRSGKVLEGKRTICLHLLHRRPCPLADLSAEGEAQLYEGSVGGDNISHPCWGFDCDRYRSPWRHDRVRDRKPASEACIDERSARKSRLQRSAAA